MLAPATASAKTPTPPDMLPCDGFEAGRTEITYAQWKPVFQWAETHGYRFSWDGDMGSMAWDSEPIAHTPAEPVTCVGVLDAAVWCNALSELNGLKLCYYRDEAKSEPLRMVDPFRVISYQWAEGGYRDGGRNRHTVDSCLDSLGRSGTPRRGRVGGPGWPWRGRR